MALFGSKKLIGLDIGNSIIKAIELDVTRSGATLVAFNVVQTPANVLRLGDISNPEGLVPALANLFSQMRSKRKSVAAAMWGSAVFVKRISGVPHVNGKVLDDQIRFEVEQINPFGNIDGVNFDFHIMKGIPPTPEGVNVLAVVAQKDFIFKYVETIGQLGQTCVAIDVAGCALANCFEYNYPDAAKGQTLALLNVGSEITNFVVIKNGEVVLSRDLAVGGLTYTLEIQRNLGLTFPEAENMKIDACTGGKAPQEVLDSIATSTETILDAIKGGIDFYMQTDGDIRISKIYITGGSHSVPGLISSLQEGLGIPLEVMNPFRRLAPGKSVTREYMNQVAPFAAIAVGLGLRAVGDS